MTDCLIENINEYQYKKYLVLHGIYNNKVKWHLSDCYCDDCLTRTAIAVMIIKNRGKFKNE